jgi:protein phosphatase
MPVLEIPQLSLVVLFGPTGAGKSTLATRHFRAEEILSGDREDLHEVLAERLLEGKLVVVDAGPLLARDRRELATLADAVHCAAVALVLDLPETVCRSRLREAQRDPKSVRQQSQTLKQSLHKFASDGFAVVHILATPEEVETLTIQRCPLAVDHRSERGPFDVIGDVHGCTDELEELLARLGYIPCPEPVAGPFTYRTLFTHPEGRRAIFLGDLVDRGPRSLDALQLALHMVTAGTALAVPGNHDTKLVRTLRGRPTEVHGNLARTLAEFNAVPADLAADLTRAVCAFIDGLPSHLVLAGGDLVVAHAGLREELQGRDSKGVRSVCLHGEVARVDESGTPWVLDWVSDYQGRARVVYGHAPVRRALWVNNTIDIDTGCVFGGTLTAWRYPEDELVAVPARRVYKASHQFPR